MGRGHLWDGDGNDLVRGGQDNVWGVGEQGASALQKAIAPVARSAGIGASLNASGIGALP